MRIENVVCTDHLDGGPVDLEIDDGVITSIVPARRTESPARIAIPGLVDLHTHLREPGGEEAEDIASGTAAAVAGGYTDVFAMPNTLPATDSAQAVVALRARAAGMPARVHVVAAATVARAGLEPVDADALAELGVVLFSDDGSCVADDGVAELVLAATARTGTVFAQHAQHPLIVGRGVINERVAGRVGVEGWPVSGESSIIARDIELVRRTGGRLHVCHVSTAEGVELIRAAKSEGLAVTAEVTPHHLLLSDHDAAERGPALKVNPPLRSEDDIFALRSALRDGTIDVVGTDHAPHPARTKSLPWANAAFGLTALETALPAVAEALTSEGRTDWRRLAEVMSIVPAMIGRLGERRLEIGARADLCVIAAQPWRVDPAVHVSRSANTPFAGRAFAHRVVTTVRDGVPVYG